MSAVEEEEYRRRYRAAAHAMQTGVKITMEHDPAESAPKHLRVGINSALVDSAALAGLLIAKGIISREEYLKALAEGMEREQAMYQQRLTDEFGVTVKLG